MGNIFPSVIWNDPERNAYKLEHEVSLAASSTQRDAQAGRETALTRANKPGLASKT
jgi:hypothetical protein